MNRGSKGEEETLTHRDKIPTATEQWVENVYDKSKQRAKRQSLKLLK